MVSKFDIVIFFLLIWLVLLIPFDPDKKNVIYNGSKKTRIFCCISGITGILCMFCYELFYRNPDYKYTIECLFQIVSVVLIVCTILCYKELLARKNPSAVFWIIAILSAVLGILSVVWLIFYWIKVLEFDVYLFVAPQIGSIMLSAHGDMDIENAD